MQSQSHKLPLCSFNWCCMFSRHEHPVRASNSVGLGPGDRVHLRTHPEEVFQLKEGICNAKVTQY